MRPCTTQLCSGTARKSKRMVFGCRASLCTCLPWLVAWCFSLLAPQERFVRGNLVLMYSLRNCSKLVAFGVSDYDRNRPSKQREGKRSNFEEDIQCFSEIHRDE